MDGGKGQSYEKVDVVSEWAMKGKSPPNALKVKASINPRVRFSESDFTFCQARLTYASENFRNETTYRFLLRRPC